LRLGGRVDLRERGPEAQGSIAGGQHRGFADSPALEVVKHLQPGDLRLAFPVVDGHQFLGSVRQGTDQDQEARPVIGESDVEVDAVRPQVDVAFAGEIPFVPPLVILLPTLAQAPHAGRGQTGGPFAEDGGQGFAHLLVGNALEVERGNQVVDGRDPAQIRGQDLAGELERLVPVTHPGHLDRDGAEPGLERPGPGVSVAHDGLAACRVADLAVLLDEVGDLPIKRVHEEADRPLSKDLFELGLANFGCGLFGLEREYVRVGGGHLGGLLLVIARMPPSAPVHNIRP
jgi:hypothetical protein